MSVSILLYYWLDVLNHKLKILSKACHVAFDMRKSESSKVLVIEGRQGCKFCQTSIQKDVYFSMHFTDVKLQT